MTTLSDGRTTCFWLSQRTWSIIYMLFYPPDISVCLIYYFYLVDGRSLKQVLQSIRPAPGRKLQRSCSRGGPSWQPHKVFPSFPDLYTLSLFLQLLKTGEEESCSLHVLLLCWNMALHCAGRSRGTIEVLKQRQTCVCLIFERWHHPR